MDKYKMNYIFSGENEINAIFIKVLNKELKKYILTIDKNKKYEVSALSLEEGRNC